MAEGMAAAARVAALAAVMAVVAMAAAPAAVTVATAAAEYSPAPPLLDSQSVPTSHSRTPPRRAVGLTRRLRRRRTTA